MVGDPRLAEVTKIHSGLTFAAKHRLLLPVPRPERGKSATLGGDGEFIAIGQFVFGFFVF